MIWNVLETLANIAGWVLIVSALVAVGACAFVRHLGVEQIRQEQAMHKAWSRAHGGDPEYAGGVGRKAQ